MYIGGYVYLTRQHLFLYMWVNSHDKKAVKGTILILLCSTWGKPLTSKAHAGNIETCLRQGCMMFILSPSDQPVSDIL